MPYGNSDICTKKERALEMEQTTANEIYFFLSVKKTSSNVIYVCSIMQL